MNNSEIKIITKRLELRCITPLDTESIFEYRSNSEVYKFQTWRPKTLNDVKEFICEKISKIPDVKGTWYQLGIILKETHKLIGDIGIHFNDEDNQQVEIGYTLSQKYQGKGYATEAVEGVINYIFNDLNKHRVTASVDPQNTKSIALLERIGMRREAHFKKSYFFNGHWADDVIYALLKEEWKNVKVIYGTSNPAKLLAMRRRLKGLGIEILGLKDLNMEIPSVPEDGHTPLENARQKALAYYKAFHMPVFSCDSGLYFDNVPDGDHPGVHVRNVNGTYHSDQEMIVHYSSLARKYGDLTARYKNAICFVMDEEHIYQAMEPSMESEKFIITSKPHSLLKKGFPLDSLSIDIKTGKYYYDLPEDELDQVAVEDGFLEFFKSLPIYIKMKLEYRLAVPSDLDDLFYMFQSAIKHMEKNNIFQWDHIYPDKLTLGEDIEKQQMTLALINDEIAAAFVINTECDDEYADGAWNMPDARYMVVHRLCVNPYYQHMGIARKIMEHIEKEAMLKEVQSIRLDAYTKNPYALRLYESIGYITVGYANWRKGRFCLMEKVLDTIG